MRLRLRLSLVTAAAILAIAATIYGWPYVRASIRSTTTSSQGAPIEHATPKVDAMIHRLAYLADALEPDVHFDETDRPESVTSVPSNTPPRSSHRGCWSGSPTKSSKPSSHTRSATWRTAIAGSWVPSSAASGGRRVDRGRPRPPRRLRLERAVLAAETVRAVRRRGALARARAVRRRRRGGTGRITRRAGESAARPGRRARYAGD